jgi:5'-3' exonuclease
MNGAPIERLLVDARNLMYRAAYAALSPNCSVKHASSSFLTNLAEYLNIFRPNHLDLFWDAPRDSVWRRQIYPRYKDRVDSGYVADMRPELNHSIDVCTAIMKHMPVRQYARPAMEADDLIHAAVTSCRSRCVIISTDSDMLQIPYRYQWASVYEPKKAIEITHQDVPNDPCWMKALAGDRSDSITGYDGIGPVTAGRLLTEGERMSKFLAGCDRDLLKVNLTLVDLSMSPYVADNQMYTRSVMAAKVEPDRDQVIGLLKEHKLNDILLKSQQIMGAFAKLS